MSTAAQRTFNPHGAGASPAGSTNTYPVVIEGGHRRGLPVPSNLSHRFYHGVPEQRRDRPAKPGIAGARPAAVSTFGVVVPKAARRARNAEETERYRPAPPVSPERCSIDARLSSKQQEPERYRPRAPLGPGCPSGRVGLQIRPGGCESLRACQISTEVKPI